MQHGTSYPDVHHCRAFVTKRRCLRQTHPIWRLRVRVPEKHLLITLHCYFFRVSAKCRDIFLYPLKRESLYDIPFRWLESHGGTCSRSCKPKLPTPAAFISLPAKNPKPDNLRH